MAKEGDPIAMTILRQMAQQGPQKQGGRQKEPPNPEQPLGLQSSTGMPSEQAQGNPTPGQSETEMMQRQATASPGMDGSI